MGEQNKSCKNCKYCGRQSSHLKSEYLKNALLNDQLSFSCSKKGYEYFTSTWVFSIPPLQPFNDMSICDGKWFEKKPLQLSFDFR